MIKPEPIEYKGWGYRKMPNGTCIIAIAMVDGVQFFSGLQKEVEFAIDLMCAAEEAGLPPEVIGLSDKVAGETLSRMDN